MLSKNLPRTVVVMLLLTFVDQGIMDKIHLCLCHGQNDVFSRRL